MSTQKQPITEHIADSLELPKDVVLGVPLLSLCGDREVCIDNHTGIAAYESNLAVVRTKHFPIRIQGKNLTIDYYTRDSIKLTGQITEICFLR